MEILSTSPFITKTDNKRGVTKSTKYDQILEPTQNTTVLINLLLFIVKMVKALYLVMLETNPMQI